MKRFLLAACLIVLLLPAFASSPSASLPGSIAIAGHNTPVLGNCQCSECTGGMNRWQADEAGEPSDQGASAVQTDLAGEVGPGAALFGLALAFFLWMRMRA